jgi:hypothetical protein
MFSGTATTLADWAKATEAESRTNRTTLIDFIP